MAQATNQNPAAQKSRLTPAQRNMLFAQATRQNIQKLPSVQVVPGGSVSFDLPKTRLVSKISLLVKGIINAQHDSETAFVPKVFSPYNIIRQARIEINNGFAPYRISGAELSLYNKVNSINGHTLDRVTTANARGRCLMETVASSTGADNDVRFYVDMPLTLNDRDPIGLINVQNPSTVVTVNLDFNQLTDLLAVTTGFTLTSQLTVTPIIESFTIPIIPDALPDLSVLKLVHSHNQTIPGGGDVTVKLPVGQTYRKLIVFVEDASGGVADADLGDFQLILNQADIPYRVDPFALQAMNQEAYGVTFEAGVYVIDFSKQGLANLGGARDYIDTERLTEFWLRTTAKAAGSISVVAETLARLQG